MTAPANRWKLGLFVVAGCAATIGGMTWVGVRELQKTFHVAYAYFDEAVTGLEEGSPVKFRGVTIGVVDKIRAAPDKRHLEVRAALYDDKLADLGLEVTRLDGGCPLPDNLRAQIVMSWVTSTSFIQVDFFPDPPNGPQQLPFAVDSAQNTLRTVPSTAKSLEDASREVLRELPSMATSARELVELLRTELQGARLADVSRQLQGLLQRLDRTLQEVEQKELVARGIDAVASLQKAATSIGDAASSLRDDQSPVGVTLAELRGLAQRLEAELAAAKVGETTAALRAAGQAAVGLGQDVQAEFAQLRRTLAAVENLMLVLERDPGALLRGRGPVTSPLQEGKR